MELLLLLAAVIAIALAIAWRIAATRASRRSKRRTRKAIEAEGRAEKLLGRAGFSILDRQVAGHWTLLVDGEEVEAGVRADLLVGRGGQIYVAEVKTGERAPDPSFPATRRQLLEYLHVFQPDGLLLVDMERERVLEVEFFT
ncbi:MAG TPA: hypothetical protein QGF58_23640 [Myxococcota bacterium]|nr:hypothetical protein [Myxococcota bacterium]